MNNMESLYKGFKEYFDAYKESIEYFLEKLKTVNEDKWEYEYREKEGVEEYKEKAINYDNLSIVYISYWFYDKLEAYKKEKIQAKVNNIEILEIYDETDELFIEILALIERAEKRAKGE